MNKHSGNTPDRAEQTARNRQNEYPGVEQLLEAFVNKGATCGHALNLIIYGDTLYINEGNNGAKLFYYQLVIRASDDVYFVNNRDRYSNYYETLIHILEIHRRAWRLHLPLPTIHNKVKHGVIEPATLGLALVEEPRVGCKR